jgi:hypothetical protein
VLLTKGVWVPDDCYLMSTGDSASKRKSKGKLRQKELMSKQVSDEEVSGGGQG